MTFLNNFKQRSVFIALTLVLLLMLMMLALFTKVNEASYSKVQPYNVSITIDGSVESPVFFAYDYGQGIRDHNVRRLVFNSKTKTFNFSVSAWKHVHAVYVFGPKKYRFLIKDFKIEKNGVAYQPTLPEVGPKLEGVNWFYRFPLVSFDYRQN